ncbi:MAG: HEAT repeat domain-containing protein, partial [Myxococcales bacterium]|nr:HEAT repeat domain-containing protein [Myxococcales bacterium]
ALLEATKHDAANVRTFASKKLDELGKVTPGEAVSTTDPDVLADTLRAFGHIREVEAVDVLLSFANHDRKKVRDAAREAIAAIGEPGRWRLRDAYQDLIGEKVDKSVPWDLLARRIFAIYDKSRVAELWGLFSSGLDAAKAGKAGAAVESFDKVLARDPLFDRRSEMAMAYFEHARTIPFEEAERRLAMLRKARRLSPAAGDANKIEAEIAFTEAKVLIKEGRPERYLLTRATELDPTHVEAKELLASFEEKATPKPQAAVPRYTLAGGIGAAALLLIGFVAFFRRKKGGPEAERRSLEKEKAGVRTPAPSSVAEKPPVAFPPPPGAKDESGPPAA